MKQFIRKWLEIDDKIDDKIEMVERRFELSRSQYRADISEWVRGSNEDEFRAWANNVVKTHMGSCESRIIEALRESEKDMAVAAIKGEIGFWDNDFNAGFLRNVVNSIKDIQLPGGVNNETSK